MYILFVLIENVIYHNVHHANLSKFGKTNAPMNCSCVSQSQFPTVTQGVKVDNSTVAPHIFSLVLSLCSFAFGDNDVCVFPYKNLLKKKVCGGVWMKYQFLRWGWSARIFQSVLYMSLVLSNLSSLQEILSICKKTPLYRVFHILNDYSTALPRYYIAICLPPMWKSQKPNHITYSTLHAPKVDWHALLS